MTLEMITAIRAMVPASIASRPSDPDDVMNVWSTHAFHMHGIDLRVETDIPSFARGVTELLDEFPRSLGTNGNSLTVFVRAVERGREGRRERESRLRGERIYSS